MAIRDGNMSTAMHFEMIARSNDARNQFARENARDIKLAQKGGAQGAAARKRLEQAIGKGAKYNNITIGMGSLSSIIKHGGSVVTAVDDGRFEAGGTFKSAKAVGDGIGVAGEKGKLPTSYSEPSKSTTTSITSSIRPKTRPSSGAGDSSAAQNAIAAAAKRRQELKDAATAKHRRDRLAREARDRRRNDRSPSFTPPKPKPKPTPTRTDRFGRSRSTRTSTSTAAANRAAASTRSITKNRPRAKGGLMEKDK